MRDVKFISTPKSDEQNKKHSQKLNGSLITEHSFGVMKNHKQTENRNKSIAESQKTLIKAELFSDRHRYIEVEVVNNENRASHVLGCTEPAQKHPSIQNLQLRKQMQKQQNPSSTLNTLEQITFEATEKLSKTNMWNSESSSLCL